MGDAVVLCTLALVVAAFAAYFFQSHHLVFIPSRSLSLPLAVFSGVLGIVGVYKIYLAFLESKGKV